jgi:molybdopterin synthase catalytic subunit
MTIAQTIYVKVLFFGAAKDLAGTDEKTFELSLNISAADAFKLILQSVPALSEKFGKSLLFALNQSYATGEETVNNGDELAIFPPVSGGSSETTNSDFIEVTYQPLDVGSIARRVVLAECGATVTLDGYVRQWTKDRQTSHLVYEAYESMALSEMQKLVVAARAQFEIASVGIVHRLGRLEIGETSVVISVGAPHRRAAFAACEWLIKELKRTVPIWKKEFYADADSNESEESFAWVEGENQ